MNTNNTIELVSTKRRTFIGHLRSWCYEGARTVCFKTPRWDSLNTNAIILAGLVLTSLLFTLIFQRLYIVGPAIFNWKAVTSYWIGIAANAWISYLLCDDDGPNKDQHSAPTAAHLLSMLIAQSLCMMIGLGLFFTVLFHAGMYKEKMLGVWVVWLIWLTPLIWVLIAQIVLLWRGGNKRAGPMALSVATLLISSSLLYLTRPAEFWYADTEEKNDSTQTYLKLTQQLMEAQPRLLSRHLDAIKAHSKNQENLYAITYAPYEDDVFRKESELVSQVMTNRFSAEGKVLQLVNNVETAETLPWATPLNLQRAIQQFAQKMDRNEDILFIHITSHGAKDGKLATYFWPLELENLQPAQLKKWLDDAGIRNRIISVSACYSGSWIPPLANENTLVITAADDKHTSYGCGRKSELTFFGKAMYDEQIRSHTLSFEEAYHAAREVIQRREQEVGKDDGFSNPQISVGEKIRTRLAVFQKGLSTNEKKMSSVQPNHPK